jgi:non-homologous end joining protein Ku
MNRLGDGYNLAAEVDNRQQALAELLAAKLEGTPTPHGLPAEPEPADVVNLMDALKASMDATEQAGEEE